MPIFSTYRANTSTLTKTVVLTGSLATALLTTGCSSVPQPTEQRLKCKVEVIVSGEETLSCEYEAVWESAISNPVFDASLLEMDYSASSALISGSQVFATLVLEDNDIVVATQSFPFAKVGNSYLPTNPAAIENFLHGQQGDELSITTTEMNAEPTTAGTNTVVMELRYDNDVVTGTSHSWYVNSGDLPRQDDWIDP